jgi:hypothetical protein
VKGNRARLSAWAILIALTAGIIPAVQPAGVAYAQNLGQRNVAGLVLDANSAPVQGATVFLKNQKTKSIRSYTSAANGSFRFAQVNMTDDYDLWAEKEGKKSPTKTVSNWDARKEFSTELKFK